MQFSPTQIRTYSWILLAGLLIILFLGTLVHERINWPQPALLNGESTYLMQAESLAFDFDLAFTSQDFHRFLLSRHGEPPDLELASGSAGRRITYDRPFPYALWLAPFLRFSPQKGFLFANLLLLTLIGVFAATALNNVLGPAAPAWVTLLLFASVAWSYVWLASGDLFLMAVVVIAIALLTRLHDDADRLTVPRSQRGASPRLCLIAGALLTIPFATRPLYGFLLLAGLLLVPKSNTVPLRGAFLLGSTFALLAQVAIQWWWSGGLHFLGVQRFRFTPETGFPMIDFTAADWTSSIKRFQALHWDGAPRFSWGADPLLWLWDLLYFTLGRHVGLLPYFLPLVLILLHTSFRRQRQPLMLATVAWIVALIVLHPFNFYGGDGAIANRLFLPFYGALWFLLERPPRWFLAPVTAGLAALFVANLWTSPWRHPPSKDGGYTYVTTVAEKILPFETSQRPIPANQLVHHLGLRLNLLNEGVWAETRRELLKLDQDRRAQLVVASPVPLPSLTVEFGADAPGDLQVHGADLGEKILLADGGISFELELGRLATRHHAVWWTAERQWLYVLKFELPRDEDSPDSSKSLAFQLFSDILFEDQPFKDQPLEEDG